ncbi:Cu(I)-responsive transcriptional regulator [Denitrificimonas caeni]|uniref:Cu(I)-responsive transcriptional regulator n=1 Tax=Denitrificimonas caeni TaxID=521720 RepID=UPI0019624E33|nr:Cu(I)-responsive transcriptional regulator [Denitrificimonas caeni]
MNIGEAAAASGVSRKMIRYYEETGLLATAPRSDAGYRLYNESGVQQLLFIKRARDLGFSLERIKTLLDLWQNTDRHSADVKALAQQYMAELDQDIMHLQSMRQQLAGLVDQCHGDDEPACSILDGLAQANSPLASPT